MKADEPLHIEIDRLMAETQEAPSAPLTTDAEFLRRITLDLAGRIPTAEESRTFLADSSPDRRIQLIDRLLASPDYPNRMSNAFHVMLMERLGDHPEWDRFLLESFAQNKPWNQIVREILHPDPEDEMTRGSAFFFTKRLENYGQNPVDLPGLTRDVGRLFLGMDLQCAQCHDHLFVDDYKQSHYQGLFAFVGHLQIRQDTEFPAVAEKLVSSKVEFMSVFLQEPMATGPRLPGGMEIEIPELAEGEEYLQPPDRQTRFPGVPKFSPLRLLAEQLPTEENVAFTRNIVNRLWFLMMGRGLVHPLDLHHDENPASHPELLDLLAQRFAEHGYDIRWFLRELALTEVYQRSSRLPDGVDHVPEESFLVALEKPLSAEQLARSVLQATGQEAVVHQSIEEEAEAQKKLDDWEQRFVKVFGNEPRDPEVEYTPSVKSALFLLNDSLVLSWLTPKEGNLTHRLSQLEDVHELADELFLSVLSRFPTEQERAEVAQLLAEAGDRREARIEQLVWACLTSAEFALNH